MLFAFLVNYSRFIVDDYFNAPENYNKQAVRAYTVINQLNKTKSLLKDGETGARGFVIKRLAFLQALFGALQVKDYRLVTKLSYSELLTPDSLAALENDKQKNSVLPTLKLKRKGIMNNYGFLQTYY